MHQDNKIRNPHEAEAHEYEETDELEAEVHEILLQSLKRARREKRWYWRIHYWLKAVRWSLKMARQEFIDVYRARND